MILDSTFIRSCEDGERHLEIKIRNVETASGGRQVFGAVANANTDIKVLIRWSLGAVGRTEETGLTVRRPSHDGRRNHGHLPVGLLHRYAGGRRIHIALSDRDAERPDLHNGDVRQPVHDLRHPPTPASMGLTPQHMADSILHRRHPDRRGAGRRRHCDGAAAGLRGGRYVCGRIGARVRPGSRKDPGVRPAQDRLTPAVIRTIYVGVISPLLVGRRYGTSTTITKQVA